MPVTAYLVDSSPTFYGQPFFDSKWQGPIEYNNHIYVFAENDNISNAFVGAFKSDQSYPGTITSFTPQDTVNAPDCTSGRTNVFYPKTGGSLVYISVAGPTIAGGSLRLYTYDMSTDTYATVATGGPIPNNSGRGGHRLVHRANGDWVLGYDLFTGGLFQVYWSKYDGAWSAGVQVSTESVAGTGAHIVQLGVNATDDVIFYREYLTGTYAYNYSVLSTAGALTAVRTLTTGSYDLNQGNSGGPYYLAATDQWCFPFTDFTGGFACIAKSGPSANPSADSIEQVAAVGTIADVPGTRVTADSGETTLYCEWNIVDTNHQLVYATQTIPSTTWSGSTLLFDSAVDTLSPDPGASPIDVQRPSITISSTVEVLYTFGTFAPAPSSLGCDVQYFGQSAAAPPPTPLTLACPVGGGTAQIGVFYDQSLVAAGGTPPYTFEIIP